MLLSDNESWNAAHGEDVPPLDYQIIPGGNMRGGPAMISSDGHRYGIKRMRSNVTHWRCVERNRFYNCHAAVIQRGDAFIPGTVHHCHPPHHLT